jgi:WD40 repeat protein
MTIFMRVKKLFGLLASSASKVVPLSIALALSVDVSLACDREPCTNIFSEDLGRIRLADAGGAPLRIDMQDAENTRSDEDEHLFIDVDWKAVHKRALQPSDYAAQSPKVLLQRSFDSPSEREKVAIRSYLANQFGESEEGYLSRAWLAVYENKDYPTAVAFLNKCLEINPNNLMCHYNLSSYLSDQGKRDDAIKALVTVVKADMTGSPSKYLSDAYSRLASLYGEAGGDALSLFLKEIKGRFPNRPAEHIVQAQILRLGGETKAQEEHYEKILEEDLSSWYANRELANLRYFELSKKDLSYREKAISGMNNYIKVLKEHPVDAVHLSNAYRYIAERRAEQKNYMVAFAMYQKAFVTYPTAEDALGAYRVITKAYPIESFKGVVAIDFLLHANEVLPENPAILHELAVLMSSLNKLKEASRYFNLAINATLTEKDRISETIKYAQIVLEDHNLDFDTAKERYEQLLTNANETGVAYETLLSALYWNRLDANDYRGALKALDRQTDFLKKFNKPINKNYFIDRRHQLLKYIDSESPARQKAVDQLPLIAAEPLPERPYLPNRLLAISSDGLRIVTGDWPTQLWDATTKKKIANLESSGFAKFSPDGRYLATYSNFRSEGEFTTYCVTVYDATTGQVHGRDVALHLIRDLDWSPGGNRIVYGGNSFLAVYDVINKKRILRTAPPGNSIMNAVTWLTKGLIVTGQAEQDHLIVWDEHTLSEKTRLQGVFWPHALVHTSDSAFVAAIDDRRVLSVWDTEKWKLRQMEVAAWGPDSLMPLPGTHKLLAKSSPGNGLDTIALVDLDDMTLNSTRQFKDSTSASYAFSHDGKLLYRGDEQRITPLEVPSLEDSGESWLAQSAGKGSISDIPDGYFLTYDKQSIHVWDVGTGRKKTDIELAVDDLERVKGDHRQIVATLKYVADKDTAIRVLDTQNLRTRALTSVHGRVSSVSAVGHLAAIGYVDHRARRSDEGGKPVPKNYAGKITLVDLNTGEHLTEISVPMMTGSLEYTLQDPTFERISLSPDGKRVLVLTSWADGYGRGTVYSSQVRIFNVKTGKLQQVLDAYKDIRGCWFEEDGTVRIVTTGGRFLYDLVADKELSRSDGRSATSIVLLKQSGGEIRWGGTFIELSNQAGNKQYIPWPEPILGVGVFEEQHRLAVYGAVDGLRIYEMPDR